MARDGTDADDRSRRDSKRWAWKENHLLELIFKQIEKPILVYEGRSPGKDKHATDEKCEQREGGIDSSFVPRPFGKPFQGENEDRSRDADQISGKQG